MIRHSDNASESWKTLPWKQFQKDLFRLQKRVYKAIQAGDERKATSLQRLILKSTLRVRQSPTEGNPPSGLDSPQQERWQYVK